jgi:hypothetical protein
MLPDSVCGFGLPGCARKKIELNHLKKWRKSDIFIQGGLAAGRY